MRALYIGACVGKIALGFLLAAAGLLGLVDIPHVALCGFGHMLIGLAMIFRH